MKELRSECCMGQSRALSSVLTPVERLEFMLMYMVRSTVVNYSQEDVNGVLALCEIQTLKHRSLARSEPGLLPPLRGTYRGVIRPVMKRLIAMPPQKPLVT